MSENNLKDYTDLAGDYDEIRYETKISKFIDSFRHDVFLELAQPSSSTNLLDVGTGTGSGIEFFSKHVAHMTGLDGTQAMLDVAQAKIDDRNIDNTKLICANALEIPFDSESFDVVTSLNFIHLFTPDGIETQAKFIADMERVVKKGGAVLVEFDNVLYMNELGNHYRDLKKMNSTMKLERIVGTYLPKTQLIGNFNESIGRLYGKCAKFPLLRPYAFRWVVKFVKV